MQGNYSIHIRKETIYYYVYSFILYLVTCFRMPKRKPSASTSGKGKATTTSTSDDHRLANIIANALVENKSALKEIAAVLPPMTIEPGIHPDGTEAEITEPDHAAQKQPWLGNTSTDNSDSDIDEENMSVSSYSHGSDRLSRQPRHSK
jgi:hypothetical protein